MTTILVLGATGMTGRPLVELLLGRGHELRVIVRARHKLPATVLEHPKLTLVEASVLDLSDEAMAARVKDCDAVVSCLGHVLDFKGMFGQPRGLCTDAVRRFCKAIEANGAALPVKFILMNTVGVPNPDCGEMRPWFERLVLTLLRHAMPPHRDNETAAAYLHRHIGRNNKHIEWCSVRPDSLIDAEVSPYGIAASPTTGIFSGRPTTRSNVAHFMAELIANPELWNTWKFRMPVIMNTGE